MKVDEELQWVSRIGGSATNMTMSFSKKILIIQMGFAKFKDEQHVDDGDERTREGEDEDKNQTERWWSMEKAIILRWWGLQLSHQHPSVIPKSVATWETSNS